MAEQLSRLFAALADPTRRDIVARLAVGDATVGQLAEPYEVSVQAVSKHLKVLEDAGLVSRSRDAQRRPVHLEAEVLELMTSWIERYRRAAEERYRRLDAVLAEMNAETPMVDRRRGADPMSTVTEARIEADPTVPVIHITRDFAGTPEQLLRAHTDPELFVRWVGPDASQLAHRPLGRADRRQLALRRDPRRRRARLPRVLPRGPAGPHRADVHLGGDAGRGGARDPGLRGPRRRAHPAARVVAVRQLRRARPRRPGDAPDGAGPPGPGGAAGAAGHPADGLRLRQRRPHVRDRLLPLVLPHPARRPARAPDRGRPPVLPAPLAGQLGQRGSTRTHPRRCGSTSGSSPTRPRGRR